MTAMRARDTDLPIVLEAVGLRASDVSILDDVDLRLSTGAPTVLIGPNGAGKTSLMRVAMGLVAVTRGRVSWGGRAESEPLRRAIMFQRPVMLRRSAAGNLAYALAAAGVPRSKRPARVQELLELVGLSGRGERPARRMSGGEQQRLALARALARDPEILFLDEPTASLDPAATKSMEDLIVDIAAKGIKVVMSTHHLGEARRIAGDIVLMHRGRIVENAPTETFFTAPRTEAARRFVAGELLV
jgi:tungstate transport system ATP-binding protein